MPTNTFFRLPEEKRLRLMDAAWEEFSRVSFSSASINQIIRTAHIPRGSFYQYFQDKEELFLYLLQEMQLYFAQVLREILAQSHGDLFAMPVQALDRLIAHTGDTDPSLARCIQVVHINPGIDFHRFMPNHFQFMPEIIGAEVETSALRQQDNAFIEHIFFLLIMSLAYAVMETLRNPQQRQQQQEILRQRVALIQHGSVALTPSTPLQEGEAVC